MKDKKTVIEPKKQIQDKKTSRRDFIKKAGVTAAGAVAASTVFGAPYVYSASNPIKWRLQTYSGAPLGAHVIKPQIEAFNRAAYGQMEIELYYADQLVPTDELFRAMQNGTIDAVQSDDATMASLLISAYSVDTFLSQHATAWMCPYYSNIMAWIKFGKKRMTKSRAWIGSVPAPGIRCIFLPRHPFEALQT
jgi:hypothetical protein